MPNHNAARTTRLRPAPHHSQANLLEHAARSRPRPLSRKSQSMRPRNRSRRRRAPSRNCNNPCSRSKRRPALMQEAEAAQAMAADAKPQRRALDEAQARAAALASELAGTRREIETQTAQSQTAVDEATEQ